MTMVEPHAPLKPASRARRGRRRAPIGVAVASAVGQTVEAGQFARPPNSTSVTSLALARLEAHGGAGRNVQAHAERSGAVEFERLVDLEEMIMRADLDRAGRRY